ncbi:TPA: protein translocase subunit SecD [Vibrio vulnificus]|uniref:Protein translocase subunit SecD n=1 Tax=Vibrio vulnificus TaxID=672 RepID=A0A8H9N1A9_VIBVL|nr:protein translocase subunit SecD [Vibrio vulnificus]HAS8540989.1 protein translocase subunit SecD [Vibrio vulnificus]
MFQYSNFKKGVSLFLVMLPLLICVVIASGKLPYFPSVGMGIDLKGGHQLLLRVERDDAVLELSNHVKDKLHIYGIVSPESFADSEYWRFSTDKPVPEEVRSELSHMGFSVAASGNDLVLSNVTSAIDNLTSEAIKKNIQVLVSRVNTIGVADVAIYKQGQSTIVVELPSGGSLEQTKEIISSSAQVFFFGEGGKNGQEVSNSELTVVRSLESIIDGSHIRDAQSIISNDSGLPVVSISLTSEGAELMKQFSSRNIGKPMISTIVDAKYINGVKVRTETLVNYAMVRETLSGTFVISGIDDHDEVTRTAIVLKSGSLSLPMFVESEQSINPRLGDENIQKSAVAFGIGLLLLAAFLMYWYRGVALIGMLSLVFTASLIICLLMLLGASLTLTGVAGIVLTMGMAIDAIIIIFERMKENTPTPTIVDFGKAYGDTISSIFNANLTTFIAAIFIYLMDSIILKGFAMTLFIGVIATLLSVWWAKCVVLTLNGGK